jgi:hypothetical protein
MNSIGARIIEFDGEDGEFVDIAQRFEKSALALADRVTIRDVRVENGDSQFPSLLKFRLLRWPEVSPRCRCSCRAAARRSNSTWLARDGKWERAAAGCAAPALATALRE